MNGYRDKVRQLNKDCADLRQSNHELGAKLDLANSALGQANEGKSLVNVDNAELRRKLEGVNIELDNVHKSFRDKIKDLTYALNEKIETYDNAVFYMGVYRNCFFLTIALVAGVIAYGALN